MPRWARPQHPVDLARGRGLLDTAIVVCLLSVLLLIASQRLLPLRGEAEAAHVTTVIGQLRSALGLTAAEMILREGVDSLQRLPGSNPVALLEEAPRNYRGEISVEQSVQVDPGSWYFVPATGHLGYRIRHPQYRADPSSTSGDRLWRIELDRNVRLIETFDMNQSTER